MHIERLSLSHNQIRTISAKTFHSTSATHLKSLNLGHNRITHLQTGAFDNLSNLEQLLLDNNLITGLQQKVMVSQAAFTKVHVHLKFYKKQIRDTPKVKIEK